MVLPNSRSTGTSPEQSARATKLRLLVLLLVFDTFLIAAVLLAFQTTELIDQEVTLEQTRQVYDIQVRNQVFTHTTIITQVRPYGWAQ